MQQQEYSILADESFDIELEQVFDELISDYTLDYAVKVQAELSEKTELLRTFPKVFAVYADDSRYRKFVIGNRYTVFYVVDDELLTVHLVHIFASMRDLPSLLS